ncbi:hypothetical protein RUM43_005533 [Polyplax serrata]|uniref:Mitochondrial import receptor subunit TOM22 homolog n=1 Tax=Polyplax serrata TaxID=468196 RepID=A0AAN8S8N8_POLSC
MASGEDIDSGMNSPALDETPVKKKSIEDDDDNDFEDETLTERLWGLTEMFPNEVRNITWSIVTNTYKSVKCLYSFSRTATWIFFSSSLILFAPVIFEIERANMEEVQRREQKQVLLGPNVSLSGGGPGLIPSR